VHAIKSRSRAPIYLTSSQQNRRGHLSGGRTLAIDRSSDRPQTETPLESIVQLLLAESYLGKGAQIAPDCSPFKCAICPSPDFTDDLCVRRSTKMQHSARDFFNTKTSSSIPGKPVISNRSSLHHRRLGFSALCLMRVVATRLGLSLLAVSLVHSSYPGPVPEH
jgi:hypothetical protein